MRIETTSRGFRVLTHIEYCNDPKKQTRVIGESSAIGDYEDSMDNPGSSFLWVGDHHLNREEINDLINIFSYWLEEKRLPDQKTLKEISMNGDTDGKRRVVAVASIGAMVEEVLAFNIERAEQVAIANHLRVTKLEEKITRLKADLERSQRETKRVRDERNDANELHRVERAGLEDLKWALKHITELRIPHGEHAVRIGVVLAGTEVKMVRFTPTSEEATKTDPPTAKAKLSRGDGKAS